ncbi:hypothetical protein LK994_07855 [Ferruginibacter lapsinanis]|uniref:hypothetical protein n=1 Tax=Ferruginibacter lapsinanis TaxID=563172 RepID=UPI001E58143F|nr:hypothetical protein [Ferruginibacter lapsinanis]UEG48549.1 hypothetical protein LK994_07855 [Ferruginibacter lapsinanis]
MMYKYLFGLFFLFISSAISAQQISVEVKYVPADPADNLLIPYKPGKKLRWADFQGIPTDTANTSAITSSGLGYKFKLHRTEELATFTFTVNCTFSKLKSWVEPGSTNDYVLNHEQRHFDISYINTFLFIQKLRTTTFSLNNYRNEIQQIYNDVSYALNNMQRSYDIETKNGIDKEKQAEWNKKIDKELATVVL